MHAVHRRVCPSLAALALMTLTAIVLSGCGAGEQAAVVEGRAASLLEAKELAEETIATEREGGRGRDRLLGGPSQSQEERLAGEEEELEARSSANAEGQDEAGEAGEEEAAETQAEAAEGAAQEEPEG